MGIINTEAINIDVAFLAVEVGELRIGILRKDQEHILNAVKNMRDILIKVEQGVKE